MPASKPLTLTTRHATRAERTARTRAESAMTPKTQLPTKPPAELTSHPVATRTWRRIVSLYAEIDGEIATAFDENLLVKYCKLQEEVLTLEKTCRDTRADYESQRKTAGRLKGEESYKAWTIVNALSQRLQGWDARLDGKRKLLLTMEQSLYLTPRSRAGVAPPEKEPESPKDDMEKLLSE